jgi:formylmethanofuran dehydrogenase subunit E
LLDEFGRFEFFAYRKRGVEPSGIPAVVTQEVIDGTLAEPDEALLAMTERP